MVQHSYTPTTVNHKTVAHETFHHLSLLTVTFSTSLHV